MELIHGNFRAFQCGILDYENILSVYRSRTHIQGSPRTPQGDAVFENLLSDILLDKRPDWVVLAVEDSKTKQLISFASFMFPKQSQFAFMKLGVSIPKTKTMPTSENSGAVSLLRLGVLVAAQRNIFDIFWSVKLNSYLPFCKLFNSFEKESGEENKSYWMLHKVVYPEDVLETSIDKVLLESALVKRLYPVAIIHTALKEKFRIEHYKHHFKVSEATLKKCTVPD
jgi:hypothetical protein